MAGKGATLAIRIISDASQASKGFDEASSRVERFQGGLDKASVAAGGVLAGIGAVAKEAFDAASALQQSTGAIDSVFGDWAVDIEQAAAGAAQAVGLAQSAYQDAAALIGSQLKGLGFPIDENVAKTQELIGVGADLAATFGGTTEDAVSALSSALKGERDPIEKYGITLSQAAVDSKVAAMGLDTSTEAAKRNADAQATLALITDQAGGALGAFAREGDTAAGAQARASAEWENAKASLGEVLLPIVAQAATKFGELAGWLVANKDVVLPLIGVVGGLAAGIIGLNAAMRAYSTVQTIVNAVMNASPLMRLVMIIGGIIAIVVTMYQKFDWFRSIVDTIGGALKWAFDKAKSAIQWVIDKISWITDNPVARSIGSLFGSAVVPVGVTPVMAGGGLAGMYGAAGPGLYGAPMTALAGGGPSAGQGPTAAPTVVVNVTMNGVATDVVAAGRQLTRVLDEYGAQTGRRVVWA